jgi:polyhydroxyalkanoate synthesis regulator phasin
VDETKPPRERGLPDALRAAVERTLAATADAGADTRGRAQEVLDEVARRGRGAREASAAVTSRLVEAIQEMRLATGDEVKALGEQIEALDRRIAALEGELERRQGSSKPEVEGK